MPGDKVHDEWDDMVREWVESDGILKCNTAGRLGSGCMKTHWGKDRYQKYLVNWYRVAYYAGLHNAEECLIKSFIPEYYKMNFAGMYGAIGLGILSYF